MALTPDQLAEVDDLFPPYATRETTRADLDNYWPDDDDATRDAAWKRISALMADPPDGARLRFTVTEPVPAGAARVEIPEALFEALRDGDPILITVPQADPADGVLQVVVRPPRTYRMDP